MKKQFLLLFACTLIAAVSQAQYNTMVIPDTLSGTTFNLAMKDTFMQLRPTGNQTITNAFNDNTFWGPTLIMNKHDVVHVNVHNGLNDSTTVHWHGMHLPAVMDGGPHQVIPPGTDWQPYWTVTNQAATMWYHPHLHMTTQEQLTMGLGGFIILRDSEEAALPLPRTYGVDDIPIALTSRRYTAGNQFVTTNSAYGDYMLANGTPNAAFTLPRQVVRLRILNAEIERGYILGFSDNRTYYVMANDGGLLNAPVPVTRLKLMVGERVEILVDLGNDAIGSTVDLKAFNSNQALGFPGGEPATTGVFGSLLNNTDFTLVHFTVGAATSSAITAIPTTLASNTYWTAADAQSTRNISVTNGNPGGRPFDFDNHAFDLSVINQNVPIDAIEKWTITNNQIFGHTFHIHDVQFKIVARNGNPAAVNDYESGWKDVMYVPISENVSFVTKFSDYSDAVHPFMYHCHFLDHEDAGMMGQFVVSGSTAVMAPNPSAAIFTVYPNPASSRAFIKMNDPSATIYYVTIYDAAGRTTLMLPKPETEQGIDISALAPGIYAIRVMDEATKSVYQQTFVKQ